MRLVYCGTPAFAVPTLRKLAGAGHSIELVVTQPDRPIGRSQTLTPPPVKLLAQELGLPVAQPEKIKINVEFEARLRAIQPDAIVVVAYGRIVPKWMLDLPPRGNLNLHASLLPKYRGAAPIQWAVANGETVTGATTMLIDEGLDTGDILLMQEIGIGPQQTAEELAPLLAESGAGLMAQTLREWESGSITPQPQDNSAATLARILTREDALIDFTRSAQQIYNRWRGFQPWPGAYTFFRGKKLTLHRLLPGIRPAAAPPGTLAVERDRFFAAAGDGSWIEILEVQIEGRKRLGAGDFLRGAAIGPGEKLGI
jgi:methionyl-tRNA formyltransferase